MLLDIIDAKKKKVGEVELAPSVFEVEVKAHLVHDVVVSQLASRRAGTHKVKERDEVRGGGAKPWKQKGTGRARAGSTRSPLFRGGGTVFGPRPRDYGYTMPKKAREGALRSALTARAKENVIMVVDGIALEAAKTKKAAALLGKLGLSGKTLIVVDGKDKNVELGFRNLPDVKLLQAAAINVFDLVNADHIVMTKDALGKIQERLAK
ncbi:MAG: 50S ribosomal protein L4 [Nitrospinae bacterium]|nr:50S ribosomal protein L4 [Nitrospinota bacterium]